MKKILLIMICSLAIFSAKAQNFSKTTQVVKIQTSAICKMCKERIERDLSLTKGIEKAELNLDDKVLTVRYDSRKTNPNIIRKNVSKIGYDADVVLAEEKSYKRLPACCQKDGHDKMK